MDFGGLLPEDPRTLHARALRNAEDAYKIFDNEEQMRNFNYVRKLHLSNCQIISSHTSTDESIC